MRIEVLDKGFIEYENHLGEDSTIVNSARISFNKKTDKMGLKDEQLIQYLWEHGHYSTLRHCYVSFRIKAPVFVFRQWFKHRIGSEFNEVSLRYTETDGDYYIPETFRRQSKDNKQASFGELEADISDIAREIYIESSDQSLEAYRELLELGVPREQARSVLPFSLYTEVYWTGSLQALFHFINLRDHSHAQWEIREYAKALREILEEIYPISMDMFQRKTFELASLFNPDTIDSDKTSDILEYLVENHCNEYKKATISFKGMKKVPEHLFESVIYLAEKYDIKIIRFRRLSIEKQEILIPYIDKRALTDHQKSILHNSIPSSEHYTEAEKKSYKNRKLLIAKPKFL